MIRKEFKMSVHPDQHAEYARRRQPIWLELEDTLLAHGVRSHSIFLDKQASELSGYEEIENEERWNAIAQTEVCQRWWKHMRKIVPSHADNSPISAPLKEVFHLERPVE